MSGNEKENVMMFDLCGLCGEGLIETDPGTGELRCGNCLHKPLVMGGQGRSIEDIERDVHGFVVFLAIIVAALVVLFEINKV